MKRNDSQTKKVAPDFAHACGGSGFGERPILPQVRVRRQTEQAAGELRQGETTAYRSQLTKGISFAAGRSHGFARPEKG